MSRLPVLLAGVALLLAGCAKKGSSATTRPAGPSDALRRPGTYSPDFSDTDVVSDGNKLDREGFKRDVDNVFMP